MLRSTTAGGRVINNGIRPYVASHDQHQVPGDKYNVGDTATAVRFGHFPNQRMVSKGTPLSSSCPVLPLRRPLHRAKMVWKHCAILPRTAYVPTYVDGRISTMRSVLFFQLDGV